MIKAAFIKYRYNLIQLLLATLVINLLSLALPLAMSQVYDRIIGSHAASTLMWLMTGCIAALLLESLMRLMREILLKWISSRFEHEYHIRLMNTLLNASQEDFIQRDTGDYIDKFNDISRIKDYFSGQVFQILLDIPFVAIYLILIFYMAPVLVLIPIAINGIYFGVIVLFRYFYEKAKTSQHDAGKRALSFLIELLSRIHIIKSISIEESMIRRYESIQLQTSNEDLTVNRLRLLPLSLGQTFAQLTTFSMICIGGIFIIQGNLTIGILTACALFASRSIQPVQNLMSYWIRLSDLKMAAGRIESVLSIPSEYSSQVPPFPEEIEGTLHLQGIHLKRKGTWLFQNLQLSVSRNRMIAIHGRKGSGTTTLMKIIAGLVKPESGQVIVDQLDISRWNLSDLRGRIEYLSEYGSIYKGTVLDNISMFNPLKKNEALDTASFAGLDDLVAHLPQGYETRLDMNSRRQLSSGLIQRINIARALFIRPRILLIDNTMNSMDHQTETIFFQILKQLKNRMTVIMVSEKTNFLNLCDEHHYLESGVLVREPAYE